MGDVEPIRGDDRPSRYIEDNGVIYRPSSMMLCTSVYVALALGHEQGGVPENMQARYDEGTVAEPFILEALTVTRTDIPTLPKVDGDGNQYIVKGLQTRVGDGDQAHQIEARLLVLEDFSGYPIYLRGSVDGVGMVSRVGASGMFSDRKAVIEVKAFGPDYWSKFIREGLEGFPGYAWQTSIYLHALRQTIGTDTGLLFAVLNKVTGEIRVQWCDEPIVSLRQIKHRIIQIENGIMEAAETGEIPDCDRVSYPCPMFHLHDVLVRTQKQAKEDERETGQADYTVDKNAGWGLAAPVYPLMEEWNLAKQEEERLGKPYNAAKKRRELIGAALRDGLKGVGSSTGPITPTAEGVTIRCEEYTVVWKEETIPEHTTKGYTRTTMNVVKDKDK